MSRDILDDAVGSVSDVPKRPWPAAAKAEGWQTSQIRPLMKDTGQSFPLFTDVL